MTRSWTDSHHQSYQIEGPTDGQPARFETRPNSIAALPNNTRAAGKVSWFDRWLGRRLLQGVGSPPISLTLWDSEQLSVNGPPFVAGLWIRDRVTLLKLLLNPQLCFGDAYSAGHVQVDGDLAEMIDAVSRSVEPAWQQPSLWNWLLEFANRPRGSSPAASRANIHHHYDIGNDFYKLWLDDQMLYSCAYFARPEMTLEESQVAKMDHVCRKVQLSAGDEVVEAGCGWGALSLHMARDYGARVKAYNISREQIQFARDRAAAEGLGGRVEFIEDDWRNISGRYDKFVSVGMLEHIGLRNYQRLGTVVSCCLKQDGIGLIHTIGRNFATALNPWTERRIFPGAYPPTIRQSMEIFERANLSVLDIENIRLHYAKTLSIWLDRFERNGNHVREMFDEHFVRMWRLYLVSSAIAFRMGELQLFQIVFAHANNNDVPWTRDYLYVGESRRQAHGVTGNGPL